jgi:hypothetical protein
MVNSSKADLAIPKTLVADTIEVVRGLHHSIQQTESRLQHVKETGSHH